MNLGFRVMTASLALIGTWVFFQNQAVMLWFLHIPTIPLTTSFDLLSDDLADAGTVGVFTFLINEELNVCSAD